MTKRSALAAIMMVGALTAFARGGGESSLPGLGSDVRAVRTVNETRTATADGTVDIATMSGSVTVRGWDRPEVKVTGTLEPDVVAIDFTVSGSTTTIDVRGPEPGKQKTKRILLGSELEVSVPAGSSVRISSVGADAEVVDVAGVRECRTLGGAITIRGGAGPVLASTLGGSITVQAPASRIDFSTMNGEVTIDGPAAEITGRTMNGPVRISGARIVDCDIATSNGDLSIDASIEKNGRLKAVTELGGTIELVVPAETEGRFSIGCRSEDIDMSAFRPRGEIAWVFRDRASSSLLRLDIWGTAGSELPAAAARAAVDVRIDLGGKMTARDLAIEIPAARITLGRSLNEFTVGAGGARVYLETAALARGKAEGPPVVLKTR
jgi:hypothetical protein